METSDASPNWESHASSGGTWPPKTSRLAGSEIGSDKRPALALKAQVTRKGSGGAPSGSGTFGQYRHCAALSQQELGFGGSERWLDSCRSRSRRNRGRGRRRSRLRRKGLPQLPQGWTDRLHVEDAAEGRVQAPSLCSNGPTGGQQRRELVGNVRRHAQGGAVVQERAVHIAGRTAQ